MVTSLIFLLIHSAFPSTNITILHTNDLHSYFQGTIEKKNSSVQRVGGYKYLAAQMKEVKTLLKNKGEDFVLTFDAGDFFSGSIYHSIALQNETAYFPEYEFFNFLDYDGITLGNHEFDGGDSGFNIMMNKVVKLGNKVPIVSTNYNRIDSKKYPILSSKILILNKGGKEIKIGLLGALGPDGCSVSKASREKNQFIGYSDKKHKVQWRKLNSLLESSAKSLRKQGADIVVLLLHGGTDEDDIIGKKVIGIDVIIAGHTHEVYQKQVNGKIISQAGSYGRFFGVLPIEIKERSVLLRSPHEEIGSYHKEIDRRGLIDEQYNNKLKFYKRVVDRTIKINEFPDAEDFSFSVDKDLSRQETGTLVSSSILKEIKKEIGDIDFYFSTLGLIRNPIYSGFNYSLEDIFNVLPIGFHDHTKLGYRVVSFYLSDKDVNQLVSFLNTYSYFSGKATPVFSNSIEIQYRKWGIPLVNKIKKIIINGKKMPKRVRVATNTFLFDYLDFIEKKTFGIVKIEPVDHEGNPLDEPYFHGPEVSYFLNGIR